MNKKIIYSIVLFWSINIFSSESWTNTYHFFPKQNNYKRNVLVFEKQVDPFNQLLVSWNALEPARGYYRFYLQIFDENNKQWTSYKMYEWGKGVKRSFLHADTGSTAKYVHVRFEGVAHQLYKKFRIRVQALDGADIHQIKSVSVCAYNLDNFVSEVDKKIVTKQERVYLADVPCISQMLDEYPDSAGWCSPTSIAQVIEYYTKKQLDIVPFASLVHDSGLGMCGSWPFNTVQAFCYLPDFLCYVTRLSSVADLFTLVMHNHPVIVSIKCTQALPGAPKAYDKGHLITVVGFDMLKKEIICHDTAEKNSADMVKHYPLKGFLQAWENRYRLAYVIIPRIA